jgi:hypothetical protein
MQDDLIPCATPEPMPPALVIETASTLALTLPASLRLLELMESHYPGDVEPPAVGD